jgi:hypothetical protein
MGKLDELRARGDAALNGLKPGATAPAWKPVPVSQTIPSSSKGEEPYGSADPNWEENWSTATKGKNGEPLPMGAVSFNHDGTPYYGGNNAIQEWTSRMLSKYKPGSGYVVQSSNYHIGWDEAGEKVITKLKGNLIERNQEWRKLEENSYDPPQSAIDEAKASPDVFDSEQTALSKVAEVGWNSLQGIGNAFLSVWDVPIETLVTGIGFVKQRAIHAVGEAKDVASGDFSFEGSMQQLKDDWSDSVALRKIPGHLIETVFDGGARKNEYLRLIREGGDPYRVSGSMMNFADLAMFVAFDPLDLVFKAAAKARAVIDVDKLIAAKQVAPNVGAFINGLEEGRKFDTSPVDQFIGRGNFDPIKHRLSGIVEAVRKDINELVTAKAKEFDSTQGFWDLDYAARRTKLNKTAIATFEMFKGFASKSTNKIEGYDLWIDLSENLYKLTSADSKEAELAVASLTRIAERENIPMALLLAEDSLLTSHYLRQGMNNVSVEKLFNAADGTRKTQDEFMKLVNQMSSQAGAYLYPTGHTRLQALPIIKKLISNSDEGVAILSKLSPGDIKKLDDANVYGRLKNSENFVDELDVIANAFHQNAGQKVVSALFERAKNSVGAGKMKGFISTLFLGNNPAFWVQNYVGNFTGVLREMPDLGYAVSNRLFNAENAEKAISSVLGFNPEVLEDTGRVVGAKANELKTSKNELVQAGKELVYKLTNWSLTAGSKNESDFRKITMSIGLEKALGAFYKDGKMLAQKEILDTVFDKAVADVVFDIATKHRGDKAKILEDLEDMFKLGEIDQLVGTVLDKIDPEKMQVLTKFGLSEDVAKIQTPGMSEDAITDVIKDMKNKIISEANKVEHDVWVPALLTNDGDKTLFADSLLAVRTPGLIPTTLDNNLQKQISAVEHSNSMQMELNAYIGEQVKAQLGEEVGEVLINALRNNPPEIRQVFDGTLSKAVKTQINDIKRTIESVLKQVKTGAIKMDEAWAKIGIPGDMPAGLTYEGLVDEAMIGYFRPRTRQMWNMVSVNYDRANARYFAALKEKGGFKFTQEMLSHPSVTNAYDAGIKLNDMSNQVVIGQKVGYLDKGTSPALKKLYDAEIERFKKLPIEQRLDYGGATWLENFQSKVGKTELDGVAVGSFEASDFNSPQEMLATMDNLEVKLFTNKITRDFSSKIPSNLTSEGMVAAFAERYPSKWNRFLIDEGFATKKASIAGGIEATGLKSYSTQGLPIGSVENWDAVVALGVRNGMPTAVGDARVLGRDNQEYLLIVNEYLVNSGKAPVKSLNFVTLDEAREALRANFGDVSGEPGRFIDIDAEFGWKLTDDPNYEPMSEHALRIMNGEDNIKVVKQRVVADMGDSPLTNSRMIWEQKDEVLKTIDWLEETAKGLRGKTIKTSALNEPQLAGLEKFLNKSQENRHLANSAALDYGIATVDNVLHDYDATRRFDSVFGLMFGFHFFHTRNMGRWAQSLVQNPQVIKNYFRYTKIIEGINDGMPDWYKQSVNSDQLMNLFPDSPIHFQLGQLIEPFNGAMETNFNDPYKRVDFMSSLIDDLGKFGSSIHPALTFSMALNLKRIGEDEAASRWATYFYPFSKTVGAVQDVFANGFNMGRFGNWSTEDFAWDGMAPQNEFGASGLTNLGRTFDPYQILFSTGFDPYMTGRVAKALSVMVDEGIVTREEAEDSIRDHSGELWDAAVERAHTQKAVGQIMSWTTGVGFIPRTEMDMNMQKFREQYIAIQQNPLTEPERRKLMNDLFVEHPYASIQLLAMKGSEYRERAYVYSVFSRVPPGSAGDTYRKLGLPKALVQKFYEDSGDMTEWSESDRRLFMSKVVTLASIASVPANSVREDWNEARAQYAELESVMTIKFGDEIHDMIQTYYSLNTEDDIGVDLQKKYLKAFPKVQEAMAFKQATVANDPESLLGLYYGGIETIAMYMKTEMTREAESKFGSDIAKIESNFMDLMDKNNNPWAYYRANPKLQQYWDFKKAYQKNINSAVIEAGSYLPTEQQVTGERTDIDLSSSTVQDNLSITRGEKYENYSVSQWKVELGFSNYESIQKLLNGQALSREEKEALYDKAQSLGMYDENELMQQIGITINKSDLPEN